ncbi:MAG TPA: triose-phosphate isomerase [Nevskiales bacterium]|nr:triose-phosphate isomerase [Nevskiales bacterium]
MGRRRLVAGNWKMHGSTAGADTLARAVREAVEACDRVEIVLCPPYPYLVQVAQRLQGSALLLGAQDVCEKTGQGAFTGEVSGQMLVDVGCRYVIVGHSERRQFFDDSDARVAAKFQAAQSAGLIPILCVGETLAEREADQTEAVLTRQLRAVLSAAGVQAFARAVLAYEPVWAIGTGRTASPEQAQAAHAALRRLLAAEDAIIARDLRILYGGSVKPDNASSLFACPDVDGGLIGGAALDAGQFSAICRAGQDA